MSTLLTDKTTADPLWPRLHRSLAGASLVNRMRKSLAAFLALRAFTGQRLMAVDDRMPEDIGLDRSEIGPMLMVGARQQRRRHPVSGE